MDGRVSVGTRVVGRIRTVGTIRRFRERLSVLIWSIKSSRLYLQVDGAAAGGAGQDRGGIEHPRDRGGLVRIDSVELKVGWMGGVTCCVGISGLLAVRESIARDCSSEVEI